MRLSSENGEKTVKKNGDNNNLPSTSPITIPDVEKNSPRILRPRFQNYIGKDKLIEKFLVFLSLILVVIAFPLSLICIFVVSRQFERAVILRNGKVHKNRPFGPGLLFYLPCVDSVKFIDLRTLCYEVPPQEALTKDSLTVSVDAVVFYKVIEPVWAVINVANYKIATQFLASTTLRNALGTTNLSELLVNRPAISRQVFELMKNTTKEWGVKVVKIEIKDIRLPLQLQKAMAAEAESTRLANAKIIVAKAEIEATKSLQLATTLLMDNPMCIQLRYLQSLQMIAGDTTHTIVFPFSVETLQKIFK
ncbi:band 7 protein AGAP004871-like [Colias croceus]|uniref:band 7 protein AGAP004871-like n=1 Tax=Colias crocea TaxID=72248 RepID=UPI001E27FEE7|nr:band 7 protein AGAP004871-like [Colias croceus]